MSSTPRSPLQLLAVAGRDPRELEARVEAVCVELSRDSVDAAEISLAESMRRYREGGWRRFAVGRDARDLRRRIAAPVLDVAPSARGATSRLVFLLPGLGEQRSGTAQEIYRSQPVFREEIDRCAETLEPILGLDLREALFRRAPPPIPSSSSTAGRIDLRKLLAREQAPPDEDDLAATELAQPIMFALELSLARLLQHWGLRPSACLGYSVGEYVAATLAGVFDPPDALRLVARRAEAIAALPEGRLLAVPLAADELRPRLFSTLSVAADNGPHLCVVGGAPPDVEALASELLDRGVASRVLSTRHAFHTEAMRPAFDEVCRAVREAHPAAPRLPFLSNLTGDWIRPAEARDPGYWARHMCEPVRFSEAVARLADGAESTLLEVGPGRGLSDLVRDLTRRSGRPLLPLPCLSSRYDERSDGEILFEAVGTAWRQGAEVDWDAFAGATPAPATEGADPPSPGQPPAEGASDPWLISVSAVVGEVLDLEAVDLEASFTDLGGTSMKAANLVLRLRRSLACDCSLRTVLQAPSLRDLAGAIHPAGRLGGALRDSFRGSASALREHALPNGLVVVIQSEAETRHFYDDIFVNRTYLDAGLSLRDGDCVFDVGSNVGLFALFAHSERRGVRLFCFEPAPELHAILSENVRRHGVDAQLFRCGLAARPGRAMLTFYPQSSGMSSFQADREEERHVLRTIVRNQALRGDYELDELLAIEGDFLDARLEARQVECPLRTVSEVIRERRVDRIDLLKIDAQKSEQAVLEGIDEEHWGRIRQVAMEIHDVEGRLAAVGRSLRERGFETATKQDELYRGTVIHNLYGWRPGAGHRR